MSIKQRAMSAVGRASRRAGGNAALGKAMAEKRTGTDLSTDQRGQVGTNARSAVGLVVGLMVGGIVAAFLLPVAIDEIVGVDTSAWGSGASSLWEILDLIIVLAVFLFFIGMALSYS